MASKRGTQVKEGPGDDDIVVERHVVSDEALRHPDTCRTHGAKGKKEKIIMIFVSVLDSVQWDTV